MNFKQFLAESTNDRPHRQVIGKDFTDEDLVKYVKEKCSDFIGNKNRPTIYRGSRTSSNDITLLTPENSTRVSANTNNAYTVVLDKVLPSQFPRRSKSIICTTSFKTASEYGEVNVLFPCNGSKIGDTSHDDIWHVFYYESYSLQKFATAIEFVAQNVEDVDIFNIENIYQVAQIILQGFLNDDLTKPLECFVDGFDEEKIHDDDFDAEELEDFIIDKLKEYFDPDNLAFDAYTPSNLEDSKDDELWIGGNIISIPLKRWGKIQNEF